ncbi:MAG: hypothetical protein D6743_18460 [Calditrichaeota bacterium]|nr:MAG: hypothetical protein D6743_18460 [Calditrichota bacterium]
MKTLWLLVALLMGRTTAFAEPAPRIHPKLVVFIAVDALRYDYLTRFEPYLSDRGFKLLLQQGANFTDAHIDHFRASTAPGHAAMLSGASGDLSGIIDNEWYDRELGQKVNCVEDPAAFLLNGTDHRGSKKGRSPRHFLVSTVGDELKLATNFRARVVGISYKDRGAILPAGRLADAAYWFDDHSGHFISSTYYMERLPGWVRSFNRDSSPDRYFHKEWRKLLGEEAYALSREDDFPNELDYKGLGRVFPHQVDGRQKHPGPDFYKAFTYTPFSDEHLAEFARAVVENEHLGADDVPDLLTISFSATDRIGHAYGPYSQEQEDQVLRLDRVLQEFFRYLDEKIGLADVLILLTADHGGAPIPEYLARFKVDAGRIDREPPPPGETSVAIPRAVENALDKTFGPADWVEAFVKPNLYLNLSTVAEKKLDLAQVERHAADALLQLKGVGQVFTSTQIAAGAYPNNLVSHKVVSQFFPGRSGNLIVVNRPYYVTSSSHRSGDKGTDHETPYDYDTHIPFLFFGKPFKPGRYAMPVRLNDMAPTLANVLELTAPSGNEGRVLYEALR